MSAKTVKKKKNNSRHYALLVSLLISSPIVMLFNSFAKEGIIPISAPGAQAEFITDTAGSGDAEGTSADAAPEAESIPDTDDSVQGLQDEAAGAGSADAGDAVADTDSASADSVADATTADVSEDDAAGNGSADDAADADSVDEADDTPDEDTPREYTAVDDDYFCDALFIGDSRMVGLSQYCEPLDTRADFYVKKALTIYNLADGKPIKSFDGTSKSLWQVLDEKQYGKIYIMVGINEIGVGNSEYFKEAYEGVVSRIREVQPDALIYINSIMHVSQSKSDSDNLYNNPNINARNDAIATLADNIHIFYLNINEAVDDEGGALRSDITFDDIHLKGSCYEPWHEYLLSHGIL